MTESRTPIRDTRSVTLNGSGAGTVTFGPGRPGERWIIQGVSVFVATNTLEATGVLYRGSERISQSFAASSGDSDNALPDEPIWPGQTYSFSWTGGDAGALATISYRGVRITGA